MLPNMNAAKRIAINISSNYLGRIVGIVSTLILTPLLVRHLGSTGYGVWVMLNTIIYFIGYLDLGLENALVKYVAQYKGEANNTALNKTIRTSLFIYIYVGFAALALCTIFSFVVPSVFNIPADYNQVFRTGLIYFGFILLFEFPSTALYGIIEGHQRYDILNIVSILSVVIDMAVTVILVFLDYGLIQIFQWYLIGVVLEVVAGILIINYSFPHISLRIGGIDAATFHILRNFSLWSILYDLMSDGWVHLQKLIVPVLFYASLTTHYSIAIMLASIMVITIDPMVDVIFPLVSELDAKNDEKNLHNVLLFGTKYTIAISLPLFIVVFLLGKPIILLLFEKEYLNVVENLLTFTLISYLATALILPSVSLLTGKGKLKKLFFFSIYECLLDIVLIVLTFDILGIYSIAFSLALGKIVCAFSFILPYTCSAINISYAKFLNDSLLKPAIPLILTIPAALLLRLFISTESVFSLCIFSTIVVSLNIALFFIFSISKNERQAIFDRSKAISLWLRQMPLLKSD